MTKDIPSPTFRQQKLGLQQSNERIIEIMSTARAMAEQKMFPISPRIGRSLKTKPKGQRQLSSNPKSLVQKTQTGAERRRDKSGTDKNLGKPGKNDIKHPKRQMSAHMPKQNIE